MRQNSNTVQTRFSGRDLLTPNRVNPYLLFYFYLRGDNSQQRRFVLEKLFLPKVDLSMLSSYRERHREMICQYSRKEGFQVECWTMRLCGRLLVGKGIGSDFENGILLHWVHGFPYITGRTLKGAARATAIEEDSQPEDVSEAFGSEERQEGNMDPGHSRGKVIFFDALPAEDQDLFDLDVTTCHYQDYYDELDPSIPGDWMDPNPVVTLTVKMNVGFEFGLAAKEDRLLRIAKDWLVKALVRRGVGAEKHSGLGHFFNPEMREDSST